MFVSKSTVYTAFHFICRVFYSFPAVGISLCNVSNFDPLLRGSTIALRDISEVATIFGFPHPSQLTENGLQVTSLKKMVEYRNAYAHAEASPIEIFPNPRRELRNVLKYIAHIFDLLNVLAKNWKTVLTERLYLTSTALQHISVIQHDTSQPIKS